MPTAASLTTGFSLRIPVQGERCNIPENIFKEDPHLGKK